MSKSMICQENYPIAYKYVNQKEASYNNKRYTALELILRSNILIDNSVTSQYCPFRTNKSIIFFHLFSKLLR